jgi:hypothetical protein
LPKETGPVLSTSLAIKRPATLQQAAQGLKRSRHAVGLHQRNALATAIECGIYLHYAKANVEHGGWAAWLEKNFAGSRQSDSAYRLIAVAYCQNSGTFADCESIDEALQIARTIEPLAVPDWLPDLLPPEPARLDDPAAF